MTAVYLMNIVNPNPTIMVFKDSQTNFGAALATSVIGDLERKS